MIIGELFVVSTCTVVTLLDITQATTVMTHNAPLLTALVLLCVYGLQYCVSINYNALVYYTLFRMVGQFVFLCVHHCRKLHLDESPHFHHHDVHGDLIQE